jgi:hypothetical protein
LGVELSVGGIPVIDELTLRVLRAVHAGMESVGGLSVALNESPDKIRFSLDNLLALGLVECGPDGATDLRITKAAARLMSSGGPQVTAGMFGSTSVTSVRFSFGSRPSSPADEWADVGRLVSHAWSAAQSSLTAEQREREGQLLVGDQDRDAALHALAAAYGEGRLTQEEHDRRTDAALHARTRADLDAVCADLAASESAGRWTGTARRTAFMVVTLVSVPLLVLAVLLISGGEARGGALGLGLLAVLVTGLLALWSWAYHDRLHLRP